MRGLVLLLLLGAALAEDCGSGPGEDLGLFSGRVDSQQIRLKTLAGQIEKLADRASAAGSSNVGQAARNLEARLHKLEGESCGPKSFQCGGDRRKCVSNLLVCDGSDDCGNGADESDDTCKVRAPAGSSWSGDVFWSSCKTFKDQTLRLIITGNRRVNYFQSRVWINAVATFENPDVTKSFNCQGSYNFAKRRAVLFSPPGAPLNVGIVCDFVSDDAADCKVTQVVSLETCARARLNKQ